MSRHTDVDPGWTSFDDVVTRLTEPVVRELHATMAESTDRLSELVTETAKGVRGVRAGQDAVAVQLKKLSSTVADRSADLPGAAGPSNAELAEQVRRLHVEVRQLAGVVDNALHGLAAELRRRDAVLLARYDELCSSDSAPTVRTMSADPGRRARPALSGIARTTWALAAAALFILVGAGVLELVT